MYNYGQLQVTFEDGSVGWYECGWGPMMSETAFFVKDVVGPKGSVSIVSSIDDSSDISSHSLAECDFLLMLDCFSTVFRLILWFIFDVQGITSSPERSRSGGQADWDRGHT